MYFFRRKSEDPIQLERIRQGVAVKIDPISENDYRALQPGDTLVFRIADKGAAGHHASGTIKQTLENELL